MLAAANAVSDADLVAGTTLKAPEVKTTSNDASTFKPYDPNAIQGSTTPSLPYITPPPKQQCNAVAMILMVVVMVAVAYFTAGAASFAMSGLTAAATTGQAVAAAAIGAAAGSVASQAVGSLMGATSFSWKQVAVDTITGAIATGAGKLLSGTKTFANAAKQLNPLGRVAQGAINYGGSVVANTIVGRDAHFSWNAVAAAVVGSYASAKLGGTIPYLEGGGVEGTFAQNLTGSFVNGAVNASARRLMGLGKQDWGQIAADAFGNALGNAAVRGIQTANTMKSLTPAQRADYSEMVKNGIPNSDALLYAQQTATALPAYLMNQEAMDYGVTPLQSQALTLGMGPLTEQAAQDRLALEAQRFVTEWTEVSMVLASGGSTSPASFLSLLTRGIDGANAADTKAIIESNLNGYIDNVKSAAQEHYGSDNVVMPALAQNAALVKIYGALGNDMPDFQWTYVGAFMANQVRDEIINVYGMAAAGTAAGMILSQVATTLGMPIIENARDHIIVTLVQGQRDVVTDLVSMALAYQVRGAEAMSRAMGGADTPAGQAFILQAKADRARKIGDIAAAERLGRDAAFQLGIHEQIRLQTMWNDPLLNRMGKANAVILDNSLLAKIARPLDIYVGANKYTDQSSQNLGYMMAPLTLQNRDATQLSTRLEIARNAFNFMYEARQNPAKYQVIQSSFTRFFEGTNLYKMPAILQPSPSWKL